MEFLVLRTSSWITEYNCDSYDYNFYRDEKYEHFYLSICYIVLGFCFLIMYLPCIFAMTKNNLLAESCYKIMFCLALYDVLGLFVSGIISGLFGLLRFGFCSSPVIHYVFGCLGNLSWYGQVMTAILLALNRCFYLQNPYLANILFGGKKTWIWIAVGPLVWSLVGLILSRPGILNLFCMVWFFNPHFGDIEDENMVYVSPYHYANNVVAATALPGVYILFLVLYYLKTSRWAFANTNYVQQSVFLQSLLISLFTSLLATVYIAVQYIPIPREWYYLTQVLWIVFNSLAAFIYLIMNNSIRANIVKVIRKTESTVIQYTPSSVVPRTSVPILCAYK